MADSPDSRHVSRGALLYKRSPTPTLRAPAQPPGRLISALLTFEIRFRLGHRPTEKACLISPNCQLPQEG